MLLKVRLPLFLTFLGVLFSGLVHAHEPQAKKPNIILEKSHIRFISKQMNVPVEGRFRQFSGEVSFDPQKPDAAHARIEVDLNSIDMGTTEAEKEVKRKPWFNVAAFPAAMFVSSSARPLGGERYEMKGKLSIKGITQDIVTSFTLKQVDHQLVAEGGFPIKRLSFNIGEGVWTDTETVEDLVEVKFKITAMQP